MSEPILLNDFKKQWAEIGPQVMDAAQRTGESGWYVLGKEVQNLEQTLASFWGLPHVVGVGNGMDAIEIALRALGLQPGEKVLTTPLSAFATSLAILRAGGIPVFVDTDASGLIDLDKAEEVLASGQIRFMVPVHLYGHSLDLDRLQALKDKYSLNIIEDCAQAIGAKFQSTSGQVKPVGSVGQAAITSFYPTKNLGALGDGGALLTTDPQVAGAALCLRDYGQSAKYVHSELGLNSRLDELHAAILNAAMLPRLAEWTDKRRKIADQYIAGLKNPALQIPPVPSGSESVWHLFPVIVTENRSGLMEHLKAQGIGSAIHYPRLISDQPALTKNNETPLVMGALTNAQKFAEQEVSLPIHPYLSDADVERVIAACNSWTPSRQPVSP